MRVRWLRGAFPWLFFFAAAFTGPAQTTPTQDLSLPPLTTTAAVQGLSREQAASHRPVRLRAVVTYAHAEWQLFFVKDDTGGIYCDCKFLRTLPTPPRLVEVEGVTDAGSYLPYVVVQRLVDLGPAPMPVPRPVSAQELWEGKYDGDYVVVGGIIAQASSLPSPNPHLRLQLVSDHKPVEVTLLGEISSPASQLIGAYAEVSGAFGPIVDPERRIVGVNLSASSLSELNVRTNANDAALSLPVARFADLVATNGLPPRGPLRLQGTVLLIRTNEIWLGDGTHGIPAALFPPPTMARGDFVELIGTPGSSGEHPGVDVVRILSSKPGVLPAPKSVEPSQLREVQRAGQLVTVEGEFLHRSLATDHDLMVLSGGDLTFEVARQFPLADAQRALLTGTRVRVTGVLCHDHVPSRGEITPRILVASANDIVVLTAAPWPLRRTLAAVSILSGCLALGLGAIAYAYRELRESKKRTERAETGLRELNQSLEARIETRTAELAAANRSLQNEIAERQRAQRDLVDREARLSQAQSLAHIGNFHWDALTQVVTWSDELFRIYGRDPASFEPSLDAYIGQIHPEDRPAVVERIQDALRSHQSFKHDYRFTLPDGTVRWATATGRVLVDDGNRCVGLEGTCQDITAAKQEEHVRAEHSRILERIARGEPLSDLLDAIIHVVEAQAEGMLCSVLLLDATGKRLIHGAAPSLPPDYCRAIDGLIIGPGVGSCGTAAAQRQRVIVVDIENDPLWVDFRDLARSANLRACWSIPLIAGNGRLLGTFACYFREPQAPTSHHLQLIESATHTTVIGIQRAQAEQALKDSTLKLARQNELLSRVGRVAQIGAWAIEVPSLELRWSEEVYRIHEVDPDVRPSCEDAVQFYAPEVRETIREAAVHGASEGTPWDLELPLITAKGRRIWVRAQGQPEYEDGRLVRLHGTLQDVTQRRAAAEELRASEERFKLAMEGANDGVWDWNLLTNATYFSPRWKSMLGYAETELANHLDTWRTLVDPNHLEQILALVTDFTAGRISRFECEFRMRHKAGHWVEILSRAFLVRDSEGHPARLVGTHVDISDRKRIDKALRALVADASNATGTDFLRNLVQQLAAVFRTRYAVVAEFLPGRDDRIRTLAVWAGDAPAPNFERDLANTPCLEVLEYGMAYHTHGIRARFPDDPFLRDMAVESYVGVTLLDRSQVPIGLLVVMHDQPIPRNPELDPVLQLFAGRAGAEIERNRFLAAVQSAEARFRSAIEHSFECLALTDAEGNCTYISPSGTRITGYSREDIVGHPFAFFALPEDAPLLAEHQGRVLAAFDAHAEIEFRIRRKDGSIRWIQTSDTNRLNDPNLTAVVSNFRDITEHKSAAHQQARLEAQLRQVQKMEAIGTLAGGIAHDFNNILGAIIGHGQLARLDSEENPPARDNLNDLLAAAHRARELVKQILTFSRRGEPERRVVAIEPVLDESIRLLRAILPATVDLKTRIQGSIPSVLADPTLIQQVIVNLTTNAAQAIGSSAGHIDIVLEGVEVVEGPGSQDAQVPPGQYARITVSDDGPGIEGAILERIFEPFFTTKAPGQGTGLGLSVVHGIVESHNGAIRVRSTQGAGATFEVYLPAHGDTPAPEPQPLPAFDGGSPSENRKGHILLVDDEPALLKITQRVLGQVGYQVTSFSSPVEARQAFQQAPHSFDLLITDYLMPGQNGVDLARDITQIRPGIPMIICTGHGFGLTRENAEQLGFKEILQKPVEFEALRLAVHHALASTGKPSES